MALTTSSRVLQDPASDLHVDGFDLGIALPTGFAVADVAHHADGALRDVMIHDAATGASEIGLVSHGHISDWTAIGGGASGGRHG